MANLEPTKHGFSTRLRFGKGQRRSFLIKLQDEHAAQKRADALEELARMLTKAGKVVQAPIILGKPATGSLRWLGKKPLYTAPPWRHENGTQKKNKLNGLSAGARAGSRQPGLPLATV